MRAITVEPGRKQSAQLVERSDPAGQGSVLARMLAVGVCGTDIEILSGEYGWAPPGEQRMVLGHESLAEVIEAPQDSGLKKGDHIVGIVRRPDPAPCRACGSGEWDMCLNGNYTERGIKQIDGYAAEQIRLEPEFSVKVDPKLGLTGVLLEPASVVAKAWDHVYRIGQRSRSWSPKVALVTGAGPIGLLAAMMGRQRGLQVHMFDKVTEGLKPDLVRALGAQYCSGEIKQLADLSPDVVIECTGAAPLVLDALEHNAPGGIVCLAGVSSGGHTLDMDMGLLNRQMVLENDVVFGSVNANRAHYEAAAQSLAQAERGWLDRLITRRVPLSRWQEAYERRPADVKVILDFTA